MSLVDLVKKIFSPNIQGMIKIPLSYYRLLLSRIYGGANNYVNRISTNRPRILFYDINGLSYAGTQKFEQILAKHLDKSKYEIYFMYSSKKHNERKAYLENSGIHLIDFDYITIEKKLPFYISGMKPHINDVVKENNIDILIISGSGYPEFPVANFTKIPIIFLNIFGSVNIQKNIITHFCISNLLADILRLSLPSNKIEVMYVPSEGPDDEAIIRGAQLRESLGIKPVEMVFGRIGRPDDNIFDSIGIRAFKKSLEVYPDIHYLIMAPPPMLVKIVNDEKIPNVHFLDPTADERSIWAFHYAIDSMAHFRYDGETCGLNIAESMLCGRPIITHKSPIWNAHLEYIDNSFGRVADINDVDAYADFMMEYITFKKNSVIGDLENAARKKALEIFSVDIAIKKLENAIDKCFNN